MTSETLTAEPFVSGLFFGECPRWHDGRLWYSDFFDHAIFSVSSDGERRVEVDFDGEPAGLGWLPDGRLLINSRLDRIILRREEDGMLVEHGDLKPWATWHANDMVVARDKLTALDRENVRKVASLRFAQDLAPDAMAGMTAKDKKDRKSTRLNSSHRSLSRMPSSA